MDLGAVAVNDDGRVPEGRIADHVSGRTYTGQTVRMQIELADGERLTIERHVDGADQLPDAARVQVSWPVAEATVIAAAA